MPDPLDVFFRWWKHIVVLMLVTVTTTAVILLFIPGKYLGTSTALPAPAYASDKTSVFSQNLQNLYSALGSPDDLDRILGTARLDTVYLVVAARFNLAEHYHIGNDENALRKAARCLKKTTRVIKTDYGEMQVKVWDTDAKLAASLSNTIMQELQSIHQNVQTYNNAMILAKINEEYTETKAAYQRFSDSLQHSPGAPTELATAEKASGLQQLQEYEKLSRQYKLMVDARPQALIIIENAAPALKPDRPQRPEVLIGAAILALLFGFLTALVLEKRRVLKS